MCELHLVLYDGPEPDRRATVEAIATKNSSKLSEDTVTRINDLGNVRVEACVARLDQADVGSAGAARRFDHLMASSLRDATVEGQPNAR